MELEELLGVGVDDEHVGGDFGGLLVVNDVQSDGLALDAGAGCVRVPLDEAVVRWRRGAV